MRFTPFVQEPGRFTGLLDRAIMDVLAGIYVFLILISLSLSISLAVYTSYVWHFPGAKSFLLFISSIVLIQVAFSGISLSRSPDQAFLWARLRFTGLSLSPIFFLLFVIDYTGITLVRRRLFVGLLLLVPALSHLILWSDHVVPGFFATWSLRSFSFLSVEHSTFGFWFQIHGIQSYVLHSIALYFLLTGILNTRTERYPLVWMFSGNLLSLMILVLPSIVGNILPLSPTPTGITLGMLLYAWGIFRHRLFDLMAIAYQMVFASLDDAVIVLNKHGEITRWNPAARRLFARYPHPLQYQSMHHVLEYSGYTGPFLLDHPHPFEMILGDQVLDVRSSPLLLSNGNSIGKILVLRDITARKKLDEALQKSQELYRLLADNSTDIILLNAPDGRFLYASPSCLTMAGYTADELLAMSPDDAASLTHPLDQAASFSFYTGILQGTASNPFEYRIVRKDGTCFWVEVHSSAIHDAGGDIRVLSVMRNIDERKQVEDSLRESEELYRLLADNSTDIILLNAPDGRFLYASPSCLPMSGYTADELLAMQPAEFYRLVHPDDLASSNLMHLAGHLHELPATYDSRLVRKDGTPFWAEIRVIPIYDEAGCLTRYLSIVHNIDQRRRMEDTLRDSNRRYDTLVASIPAMVYQMRRTPEGEVRFDYVSPTSRQYVGLEPEAIIADPFLMIGQIYAEDLPSFINAWDESARELKSLVWEGRGKGSQPGHDYWTRLEAVPLQLSDGTILWHGLHQDITAQKETQTALEASRKMVERITGLLPDTIYVYDLLKNDIVYLNRSFETLVGFSQDEMLPAGITTIEGFLHPDDNPGDAAIVASYHRLQDQEIFERDLRWRHKDGGYIWINLRETVYERTPDGEVRQILGTARDITDRRTAEDQRQQLLAQVQAANKDLKDFAYVISHDLKAPLRGVNAVAGWLVSRHGEQLGEDGAQLLQLLTGRVRRMEQMINGVLEYSRIGRETEQHTMVDLDRLLRELIQDIVPGERFTVTIESPLPTLMIDPVRIRQVFQNLIDNALKFMDKTPGEIGIGCSREDSGWHFYVRDNGRGIAPEHFERIFQLFQTLTPKDRLESTGVGLTLTRRIVERYGGKIWLDSVIMQGTTFHFTLPIVPIHEIA